MKKLFRGIVNLLVDDWQVAVDSIKGGEIKSPRGFINVVPLLIAIISNVVIILGTIKYAVAGGFSQQWAALKEAGLGPEHTMGPGNVPDMFFGKPFIIIFNILLIIAIISFAAEFFHDGPSKPAKYLFIIPVSIGVAGPIILFALQKLQESLGMKGIVQHMCDAMNKSRPEDWVQLFPEYLYKYIFMLGFFITLLGCLVLLTNKDVRDFTPFILQNALLYLVACPILLYIIENILALGKLLAMLVLLFGILLIIILGVNFVEVLDEERAAQLLDEAKAHEAKANSYSRTERLFGMDRPDRVAAAVKRAEARDILGH